MHISYDKENEKETTIVLSHLNFREELYRFYDPKEKYREEEEIEKKKEGKTEEEIKKDKEKDIIETSLKLKKESLELHYKIDSNKKIELEKAFSDFKTKVYFSNSPKFLRYGEIYTLSKGVFTIYDTTYFKKLFQIKFKKQTKFRSVIKLDNKDLIFLPYESDTLLIYRLKKAKNKYTLFQEINEERTGFKLEINYSSWNRGSPKFYYLSHLKDISLNRFFCISNYGFKMYSLNEKNEYSVVLLNKYPKDIKIIHEIDENNFIFCTYIHYNMSFGGMGHNELLVEKINIKEITKEDIDNKLKDLGEGNNEIDKNEAEQVINSLKLTYRAYKFKFFSNREFFYFNYAILKNKYFIMMGENQLLIFSLKNGEFIKYYNLLIAGQEKLYRVKYIDIKKWNNEEDNEFILEVENNIVLFELNEIGLGEINLKVLNYSYFPNITNMEKINDKENSFYSINKNSLLKY